jgi:hypothetical protein
MDIADYQNEVTDRAGPPSGGAPVDMSEPRRVLTWNGQILGGASNGEGRNDWTSRRNVTVHVAVTGSGYAYGASVAACNGSVELGYQAELCDLVKISEVDTGLLCRRPACRALRNLSTEE